MGVEVSTTTMSEHPAPAAHADHAETADAHGHDSHAHDDLGDHGPVLGPIDWRMWGVGILGVACALAIIAGFVAATGFAFNA
jgi:hypothetical protein